jgi:hypothetical protein
MSSIFRFSVGSHQRRGKIAVFALARASAGFLDPEFTPARWTNFIVDQRARLRLLEQRAVSVVDTFRRFE